MQHSLRPVRDGANLRALVMDEWHALGYERRFNAFLQFQDVDSFTDYALSTAPPAPTYYPRMKKLNAKGPEVLGNLPKARGLPPKFFKEAIEDDDHLLIDNRNTFFESTMDNFLLQAAAETAGTRIAFSNGWRYGAPIPPGPVTVNDLWNIAPPNPPVSTVELTGQEIWDMIEDNLEHTLAADPYQQMGGYVKRCLGLTLHVKLGNPAGSRIQQIFTGSEELQRDEEYTAAFIIAQGVPKKYGRNRCNLELQAIDALKYYCAAHPCVNADLRGTVNAV